MLTYNATDRILYQAVETGRLVRRLPRRQGGQELRTLYVTPKIADGLDGKDEQFKYFPFLPMENLISIYCAGHAVQVSLTGDSSKKPDFERLSGLDNVWALCARKPRFWQTRILGRFLSKGVFVGLAMYERRWLGGRKQYNKFAEAIPEKWASIFGNVSVLNASTPDDYFSGVVIDVDDIEK